MSALLDTLLRLMERNKGNQARKKEWEQGEGAKVLKQHYGGDETASKIVRKARQRAPHGSSLKDHQKTGTYRTTNQAPAAQNPDELKKIARAGRKDEETNPWAVCHSSTGPKKSKKFERCVRKVKARTGYREATDIIADITDNVLIKLDEKKFKTQKQKKATPKSQETLAKEANKRARNLSKAALGGKFKGNMKPTPHDIKNPEKKGMRGREKMNKALNKMMGIEENNAEPGTHEYFQKTIADAMKALELSKTPEGRKKWRKEQQAAKKQQPKKES